MQEEPVVVQDFKEHVEEWLEKTSQQVTGVPERCGHQDRIAHASYASSCERALTSECHSHPHDASEHEAAVVKRFQTQADERKEDSLAKPRSSISGPQGPIDERPPSATQLPSGHQPIVDAKQQLSRANSVSSHEQERHRNEIRGRQRITNPLQELFVPNRTTSRSAGSPQGSETGVSDRSVSHKVALLSYLLTILGTCQC